MPMVFVPARACGLVAMLAAAGTAHAQCVPQFTAGVDLPLTGATALALVDLNLDGRPDIVAASGGGAGDIVVTWRAQGGGSFGARVQAGVNTAAGRQIVTADFTGDGFPDVAVSTASGIEVFKNLGGTLINQQQYAPGISVQQMASADLNGDGLPDIVAACDAPPQVMVLMNDGMEGFYPAQAVPLPGPASGVLTTDFNFDGRPDVFVSSAASAGLYRMTNEGLGNLGSPQLVTPNVGGAALVEADLDGSGFPDLVALSSAQGRVNLLRAQGPSSYVLGAMLPDSQLPLAVLPAAADLTGDGVPELVIPSGDRVTCYRRSGPMMFEAVSETLTGAGACHVCVADLNDDGQLDLVVSNTSAGTVRTLISSGSGVITAQPEPQTVEFGGTAAFMVQVATNAPAPTYQWLRNGALLIEGGHFSGVNSPTLTILAATELEAGAFECHIDGCGVLRSNAATLTVGGCPSSDFNRDGDFGTDADIEAFFRVLGGGSC